MTYEFLNKAQNQPDLADFCEYIKKPLSILNDINHRYKHLQLVKRVEPENLEIYHKVDVIIEKHLPEMIDNFCEFSFDYRNTKSIDIGDTFVTPKELLLKNLAKIIEEIEIIEENFNKNNSIHAIVQNKVLNNYGYQPELCLEKKQIISDNIKLENKFDYEHFVKTTDFKHPQKPELTLSEIQSKSIQNKKSLIQLIDSKLSKLNKFHEFCMVVFGFVGLGMFSYFYFESKADDRLITNISTLEIESKKLHNDKNYEKISMNELLAEANIRTYNSYTPWDSPIEVKPIKLANSKNTFAIEFESVGKEAKNVCEALSDVVDNLESVQINNLEFKGGQYMTKDKFKSYCHNNDSYYFLNKPNKFKLIYK
jgi:uncharacterized short protein YbdD (DUF466 family)